MSLEDIAQQVELADWERRNLHRKPQPPVKKPGEPGYGPEFCDDCDDNMPAVRRGYGFMRCTACQSRLESR